jgi:NAD(P)-dependent dehydrogenase (short-subunit alcohol dehydrogenase family)
VNNICPNHVTTGLCAWQNEYFAEVAGHADVGSYMAAMRARIPMGLTGLPADTAAAVAFSCSDDAAYILNRHRTGTPLKFHCNALI